MRLEPATGISREQALDCFRSDDLIGLGMEADAVRRELHPEGVVSYVLEGTVDCGATGPEAVYQQIREWEEMGATAVSLEGAFAQKKGLEDFAQLVEGARGRFPAVTLRGCSAGEIYSLANAANASIRDTLIRLMDAGVSTVSHEGPAAAIEHQRQQSGYTHADGMEVHRSAHAVGMTTVAWMTVGRGERVEERVDQLESVRRVQEETGGFRAFALVSSSPAGTAQGREEVTSVEYLKTLAIARMYLRNVEHVQTSAGPYGLKVVQMGLRFGANDVGSVMPEISGGALHGRAPGTSEEEMRRVIRDAGFRPVQRDALFRRSFLD